MALRANGPALYELLKDGQRKPEVRASSSPAMSADTAARRSPLRQVRIGSNADEGSAGAPLRAGVYPSSFQRLVAQIPMRYAVLGAACLAIFIAVVIRFVSDRAIPAEMASQPPAVTVRDPLVAASMTLTQVTDGSRPAPTPVAGKAEPAPAANEPVKGWTYLVLATVSPAESSKMVAFLAANGVDAMAVPSNNGRFHQVLALPGLPDAALRRGDDGRRIVDQVKAVGSKWKSINRGNSDFHDAFWDTH
ncbi:MAG: hypothetical protein EXS00_02035 [Phycisphaerales bacterium]|nr:hypothetical protein [Phycisphaerales bacterium]